MRAITNLLWVVNGGIVGIIPSAFLSKIFVPTVFGTGEYKLATFYISLFVFVPVGMLIGNKFLNKLRDSHL
jgi:uncharacterized membrane protein YccF (DUF307 family)